MNKKKTSTNKKPQAGNLTWKSRLSELKGYQEAFYLTDKKNDYIRVDYNLKEKRVRLYIEVFQEGGNAYFSVISQGRITTEKNVSTGRSYGFSDIFADKADIFSTIPNNEVIKLFDGNYGIRESASKLSERQKNFEATRKRYFVELRRQDGDQNYNGSYKTTGSLSFRDIISGFFDILAGIFLSIGLFYILGYNFIAMGIFAVFYGISIGAIDFFVRERDPSLIKILFFIVAGIASYIYGYYIV